MSMRTHPGADTVSENLGRELNKLLGKRDDSDLARRIGRMVNAAYRKGQRSGVAPVLPGAWTEAESKLFGTMPDKELARRLGRTVFSIRSKRLLSGHPRYHWWTEAEQKLLGKLTDDNVARRTGHAVRGVQLKRQRCGILNPQSKWREWTAQEESLLGTGPDANVARLVRRSVSAAEARRRQLRIPIAIRTTTVRRPYRQDAIQHMAYAGASP